MKNSYTAMMTEQELNYEPDGDLIFATPAKKPIKKAPTVDELFAQGVRDAANGADPTSMMDCEPYVCGLRVQQAVMAELAEMMVA